MNNNQAGMAAPAHARYRYPKKPYYLPYQIKYLNLAIRIFNTDIDDILLSRNEKALVIDDLSKELTNSEKRGTAGDCHNNRTVSLARRMQKGEKAIVKWQVCSAILRFQMDLPKTWLDHPTFKECWDGASYLVSCITRKNTYSKEELQRAMGGVESAESLPDNNPGEVDVEAPASPIRRPENTPQARAVQQNKSRKRKEPDVSAPSTIASSSTPSGGQSFVTQGPRQNKGHTERDESAAIVQGHIEVIEIKSEDEDEDVKLVLKRQRTHAGSDGEETRYPVGNDTISQTNAVETLNTAEAQHEVERQITTETNAAEMQKTIPELRRMMQFLPDIAISESKTFRKDILRPRIAMIQSNGWNDLVQWARQLVVASGKEYRQYVAEQLREKLTERVNKLSG